MQCIRFTSIILLGLLFAHQVLAVSGKDVVSKQKEIGDDEITSSLSKKIGVGGRKMMMRNQEYYLRNEYFIEGGTSSTKNISGATTCCGGNCQGKGEIISVKCNLGDKTNIGGPPTKIVVGGARAVRFVAFSADYHGPKRHPPKHN